VNASGRSIWNMGKMKRRGLASGDGIHVGGADHAFAML